METLLEMVGEKCVSLRSLRLERIRKIEDEDLVTLCKLSSLTCLNFSITCCQCVGDLSDIGMKYLGSLRELQVLKLVDYERITDVGIEQPGSLTSLMALCLLDCCEITDEGISYLQNLGPLRDMKLTSGCKATGARLRHVSSLKSVTKLHFVGIIAPDLKMLLTWGIW